MELWSGVSLNFYYLVLMLFLEISVWKQPGSRLEADLKQTGSRLEVDFKQAGSRLEVDRRWTFLSSFVNSQVGLGVLIVQKWPPSFEIVLP